MLQAGIADSAYGTAFIVGVGGCIDAIATTVIDVGHLEQKFVIQVILGLVCGRTWTCVSCWLCN